MADWRNQATEERPTFAPSILEDEAMVVGFLDDGRIEETRNGEATVFGVQVQDAPDGAEDMNGDPIEEGEDYDMMTSSSRLLFELKSFADDLADKTARIEGHGPKKSFDRTYTVESP